MKLMIICGPQAVGKMTVGQELQKQTDLKLFHNHMTIDLVSNFFNFSSEEGKRLVHLFRNEIFESVAKSHLEGLIFTYVWAFNMQEDWDYIENLVKLFQNNGADVYFVELETDIKTRLERNKTPNRLEHKPTKKNIEWTEGELLKSVDKYRLNSNPEEIQYENYLKINNTTKTAKEVADEIITTFNLEKTPIKEKI